MSLVEKMYPQAVEFIEQHGFLLVFPKQNSEVPNSLWNCFYPHYPMRWDWDQGADSKVVNMWYLREKLARERDVVYGKFYQGRATLFSKKIFKCILAALDQDSFAPLSRSAKQILESLEIDSPLSTKQLREVTELKGKMLEGSFHRATKELWSRGLIVGMGEVDDGAFPSLAHGATSVVFEELLREAQKMDPLDAYFEILALKDAPTLENGFPLTREAK